MRGNDLPLPPDTVGSLNLEASTISPIEAARVSALAILIFQTINTEYGKFIPPEMMDANCDLGKRVIVTDDLETHLPHV